MRASTHRTSKYKAKIDGDIQRLQLRRYKKTQDMLFKSTVIKQVNIEIMVKNYLAQHGISTMYTNYYILFAKHIAKSGVQESNIEFNRWAARGLSWYHLRNIGRFIFNDRLNLRNICRVPGVIGYWNFFEGSGVTAHDLSGQNQHGSLEPGIGSVTDETFTSVFDTPVQLHHTGLTPGTVVVTDKPSDGAFTEDSDYTIDYPNGTITVLLTGTMLDATDYLIDYAYTDPHPIWITDGLLGNALQFDGIDDHVNCGNDPIYNFTSENFSVMLWIKPHKIDIHNRCICRGLTVTDGWYVYVDGSGAKRRVTFATAQLGTGQVTLSFDLITTPNVWYFIVVVRNGSNGYTYINGVDETKTAGAHIDPDTSTRNLYIGGREELDQFFNGDMDEVRIFNRALTAEEIKNMYNAEKPFHFP